MIKRWGRTGHMELTVEKGHRREREMQRKEGCSVRSQGHGRLPPPDAIALQGSP